MPLYTKSEQVIASGQREQELSLDVRRHANRLNIERVIGSVREPLLVAEALQELTKTAAPSILRLMPVGLRMMFLKKHPNGPKFGNFLKFCTKKS